MIVDENKPIDDQFTDLLAAYDDALAAGSSPLASAPDPGQDLRPRLERGMACLHLLRTLLPGGAPPGEAMPAVLGRFQIRRELGHGSFGRVFLAFDPRLGRDIALKIPRPEALGSHDLRDRFAREARAAAGLDHPHIVPVYEAGEEAGVCYIASAYCPGPTLAAWLKEQREPVPVRVAAALVATLAEAVEHAHGRGVLHRDLKPSNVILSPIAANADEQRAGDGLSFAPRVTDFGLAKLLGVEPGVTGATSACETQSGAIVGTPHYMAPEQAAGKVHAIGRGADVYALGAILYELLTGRPPFQGDLLETLEQVRSQEPVPPSRLRPALPRDLQTVCLKCLQKEPGRRYVSAAALANDLRRFLAGEPVQARPVGHWEQAVKWVRRRPAVAALLAVSGLAALALVGFGVGIWYNGQLQAALREAESQRTRADELRGEAESQRAQFELLQRQTRYVRDIDLAWRSWQSAHINRVREILDGPGCPPELRGWEWGYLRGLCHKEVRVLEMEGNAVSVAYSPDCRWLAAGNWGDMKSLEKPGTVVVWETGRWRKRWEFRGAKAFHQVAFSPDSRWLASGNNDHTAQVWDVARGELVRTLKEADAVRTVAFSPDGRTLASAGREAGITLWDTVTWQPVRVMKGHTDPILQVAFSPDGRRLASVGQDRALRLWDTATGETVVMVAKAHVHQISGVAFSPDGGTLATCSEDNTIKLWDVATGEERLTLRHAEWVRTVAFHPGGERLASAASDGTVRQWDAATGKEVAILRGHTSTFVSAVAFSPDGGQLASASLDGTVRLWDPTVTSQEFRHLGGQPGSIVYALAFAPTGGMLASACRDGTVRLWDPASGAEMHTLHGHQGWITGVAISPDGRQVASVGQQDGTVRLWDAATGQAILTLQAHEGGGSRVTFSPTGRVLASSGPDGTIKVWDLADGRLVRIFPCWTDGGGVAFSPDGRLLAFNGPDHAIRLADPATGEEVGRLRGHTEAVYSLAFSPDGRLLASASEDNMAKVWDVAGRRELHTLRGHMKGVTGVAFSPDGWRVATCSHDKTVRLWNPDSGQEVFTFSLPQCFFYGVAFSADGRRLCACDANSDGSIPILVWEADPYR